MDTKIKIPSNKKVSKSELFKRFYRWNVSKRNYEIICAELLNWYEYEYEVGNLKNIPKWEFIQSEVRMSFPDFGLLRL